MFLNGNPVTKVPAGYYPEGQVPSGATTGETVQQPVKEREGGDRSGATDKEVGGGWADGLDFADTAGVLGWANDRVKNAQTVSKVSKAGGVLGGVGAIAGGVVGAVSSLSSLSDIRAAQQVAEAKGNKELSDKLKEMEEKATAEMGVVGKALADVVASGTRKASGYLNESAASTASAGSGAAATGAGAVSRGDSGGGRPSSSPSGSGTTSGGGSTGSVSGDIAGASAGSTSSGGGGYGVNTGETTGSFAGSSTSGSTSSPGGYSTGRDQTDADKNETSGGYSMGLQKGGLVKRRMSKKC